MGDKPWITYVMCDHTGKESVCKACFNTALLSARATVIEEAAGAVCNRCSKGQALLEGQYHYVYVNGEKFREVCQSPDHPSQAGGRGEIVFREPKQEDSNV